jgi:hypothetical protein
MRETRRSWGRSAGCYVINVTPIAKQPAEFHNREELNA